MVKLNWGQAGFRSGFSCMTHVLLAEQCRLNIKMKYRVFLDLRNAYDSVPISKVITKLLIKGVPKGLCKLIQSLDTNCTTQVAVNGKLTSPIPLHRGLFQGSILSPLLFDVFIDDLAEQLNDPLHKEAPFVICSQMTYLSRQR